MKKRTLAFTLAEVLITLGIIGIVAEMTIPTLVANITQSKFINSWKKTYATLQQVQATIINENGELSYGFTGLASSPAGGTSFKNGFLPYFKTIKSCDAGTSVTNGCYNDSVGFRNLDNSAISNYVIHPNAASFVLTDGTFILFMPGASMAGGKFDTDSFIFVDVNGSDKPNTIGKDVFLLRYSSFKKMFQAHNATAAGALYPECTGDGWTCGAYYLSR